MFFKDQILVENKDKFVIIRYKLNILKSIIAFIE